LAEQMQLHGTSAWLVNTGWSGGSFGVGSRISLHYTRAIIDAIHNGSLAIADYTTDPIFGLRVPKSCVGVPGKILQPRGTWADATAFEETAKLLATKFRNNFTAYADKASKEVLNAGPLV
jgi:phosphoenolpyruvate carboxykinase (ATP)